MSREEIERRQIELQQARELEGNVIWQEFIKELDGKRHMHTEAHEDANRPAEKRAEHLHAMKELRELMLWLGKKKMRLAEVLRRG